MFGTSCPRPRAKEILRPVASSAHNLHQVPEQRVLNAHFLHFLTRSDQLLLFDTLELHAIELVRIEAIVMAPKNRYLFLDREVSNIDLQQESVKLSLGQGVCTLKLNRVFRADHSKYL